MANKYVHRKIARHNISPVKDKNGRIVWNSVE